MKLFPKMIMSMVSGAVTGASLLFLCIVAAVGFAYSTMDSVYLPGIIHAWFTTENGMPALNFNPNFTGMLIWVVVVAALFGVATWYRAQGAPSNDLKLHD